MMKNSRYPHLILQRTAFEKRLYARNRGIRPIALKEQLRICAGDEYVPYIYDVLYQRTPIAKQFNGYDFKLFQSFDRMFQQVKEKESSVGLCRLCSGYAWKWIAKDKPDTPDIQLEHTSIWWNRQTSGWLRNPKATEEMGSIYTLPGLDLNYAAVVIGPELFYDPTDNCIKIDRSHFYDNKVKTNTADDDLKRYILNTYADFFDPWNNGYLCLCMRRQFKIIFAKIHSIGLTKDFHQIV